METTVENTEKKQIIIFLLVAYGVTWLMSILMYVGLRKGVNLTSFVNTQMYYPACGVMLAKMTTKRKEEQLPIAAYICFLVGTVIMMTISVMTVFIPAIGLTITGGTTVDQLISSVIIMLVSVPVYILFWTYGREARENAGVVRKNMGISAVLIALFIVLLISRIALSLTFDGVFYGSVSDNWKEWISALSDAINTKDPSLQTSAWMLNLLSLPFNFFLTFSAFFGEEYGWRYFLQPIMMKKFGKIKGIILLGLIWGLWHICVDFMFYTTVDGPKMFVSQIITCVSVGIFWGYVYMKTQNIWVTVIMHYINNNLAVLIGGGTDAGALQNQSVAWKDIPVLLISSLVFAAFIFAKEYRENSALEIGEEK